MQAAPSSDLTRMKCAAVSLVAGEMDELFEGVSEPSMKIADSIGSKTTPREAS